MTFNEARCKAETILAEGAEAVHYLLGHALGWAETAWATAQDPYVLRAMIVLAILIVVLLL